MLNIQRYARRPFFVDAVQVTEENMGQVANWCSGSINTESKDPFIKVRVHRPLNPRQTEARVGDWVLYAGTGFKVYTPRAFEESFEAAPTDEITPGQRLSYPVVLEDPNDDELPVSEQQARFAARQAEE